MALLALGGPSVTPKLKPVHLGNTRQNLETPIKGEAQEQSTMYPRFIQQARSENVDAAARSFTFARDTEAEHEQLFNRALSQLGHNPPEDYYVSKMSGDTVAVPAGKTLSRADQSQYSRVG